MSASAGAPGIRWTLRRRIATLLLVVGAVLLALLVLATVELLQVRDRQDTISLRYFDAVRLSNAQFVALVDAENALRGYALTGDASTLAPFRAVQSPETAREGGQLRSLIKGEPTVSARLDVASAAAGRWWTSWALPTKAQVDAHGAGSVSAAEILRGKKLFDEVRADYKDYVQALSNRRSMVLRSLHTQTDLLFASTVAGLAVTGVLAALLGVLLLRWVVRPVDALGRETRAVREGDLDHVIRVAGPPEIEALGDDIEVMRRGVVAQLQDARRARDEIDAARELLQAQAADLERSNRDLEQFAYVASHDLQEPLRKVASFCQLLQKRYGGQLDERADQYIEFAVDGAKRMQRLINDLLAFSRVGRISAGQADVDLQDCLDQALRNLAYAVESTEAEITSDPLPTVHGEAPLLTQLFQNLLGNAIKFRRGDVPPRMHLGVRRDGTEWEFCCEDNGIGIEPQYAERVFVIFQRLHPKDEYEGTGIGLALCRKIVEYHGGRIWLDTGINRRIESRIDAEAGAGSGTTIRWTLPVGQRDSEGDGDQDVEQRDGEWVVTEASA